MAKAKKNANIIYRGLRRIVMLCYPKYQIFGLENLPEDPCIIVGNHSQIHGPLLAELYFPCERRIWSAGEMMHLKTVPAYAFQDFWSNKPKWNRWMFKIASYLIAPLAVFIFRNANVIGVYHDARIISTFRNSVKAMHEENANLIIFPECYTEYNHIVHQFQEKFVDVAKMYYKKSGKAPQFVPLYIAPRRREAYVGKPVSYDPTAPADQERTRLCKQLMDDITELAMALPLHKVVPYPNLPPKDHPLNIPDQEDSV